MSIEEITTKSEFDKGWDSVNSNQATEEVSPTPKSKKATKYLRYVNNEEPFLKYSYEVLGNYFSDKNSFRAFYDKINTIEEKDKFLKIASFYKFLIIDGEFLNTKDKTYHQYIDYLDHTYKYIAIFAFIEALYSKDESKE